MTAFLQPWSRLRSSRKRRELAGRLRTGVELLSGCAAATEPDFVALGGDLQALFASATEMAQAVDGTAARLHTSLSAHRISGADGLVEAVLQAFREGVQEAACELEQLKSITDGLAAIEPQLARIERVGVLLQTIAVGFAVESSRTAECQQAFGSFVDEIRGLSRRIATVERTISDELGRARNGELAGLRELEAELGAMRELSRQLEQTSTAAAGKVQDGVNRMVGLMEAARTRSDQIRRHTEAAVYQVQFGDITRQKIEHIVTVLRETAGELQDHARDPGRVASEADQALAIQKAQLEAVGAELDSAQEELEQSFARIGGVTVEFVAPLQEQSGGESGRMQALKADFDRLLDLDGKGLRLRQRAIATAGHAFAAAERLAKQMQEVQSINREMHLLALNAIVKTAALGGSGATLEVLSMQVHGLYLEADTVVAGIGAQACRLRRNDSKDARGPGTAESGNTARVRLEEGVSELRRAYEDFDHAAADAASRVAGQTSRLADATGRLGALRAFAAELRAQSGELAAVRVLLAPWCRRTDGEVAGADSGLDSRYTMQSQREVHRRVVGGAQATLPVSPAVVAGTTGEMHAKEDVAMADTAGGAAFSAEGRAGGESPASPLGDNVELF